MMCISTLSFIAYLATAAGVGAGVIGYGFWKLADHMAEQAYKDGVNDGLFARQRNHLMRPRPLRW